MAQAVPATHDAAARVAAYIADQAKELRPILEDARELLDEGCPGARHAIKWGYPTWVGNGNVASLMAWPERVNLQLFQGARLPDPRRLLEGTGVLMRHVKLESVRDLKDPAVKALVRHAWRLDQA